MSASLPPGGEKFFALEQNQPPAPPAEEAPAPQPLDPLTAQVLATLEQSPPPRTWIKSLILLGVTILFFAMTGLFRNSPANLAVLIGTLLLHETGHYLGMRWFNYQDVKMFFIPLFGAAVAGKRTSIEGYKEAIVILLGPLPGIAVGSVLAVACLFFDNELLRSATMQLLILNGFNLLPFMPLDGGRFLHLVLFSRQRHMEALFQFATGIAVALLGLVLRGWVLAGVGALMALQTRHTFRVSTLAMRLRTTVAPGTEMDLAAKIPHEYAVPLIESVRRTFPVLKQPQLVANTVRQVWERMHGQSLGLLATLAFLALYVGGILAVPTAAIVMNLPITKVESTPQPDGTVQRTRIVRQFGYVLARTELNAANQPHGKHVDYYPWSDRPLIEGEYAGGRKEGKWVRYSKEGQELAVSFYKAGLPVAAPPGQGP